VCVATLMHVGENGDGCSVVCRRVRVDS